MPFVEFVVRTHVDENVMAVPEDAISTLAGVSTVYVIDNGKARQQQVALGTRQDKLVEIVTGLKGDEMLATTNLNQLATGVSVRTGQPADDESGGVTTGGGGREGRGGRRGSGARQ